MTNVYNPHDFAADLMDGILAEEYELMHSLSYDEEWLAQMPDYEGEELPF